MKRPRSLRRKLIAILFLGLLIPLETGLTIAAWLDMQSFRRDLEASISLAAQIVAANSAAAVAFDDAQEAGETLSRLAAVADVTHAVLYDEFGAPLATYARAGAPPSGLPPQLASTPRPLVTHADRVIDVYAPVLHARVHYGTLVVRASTQEVDARIRTYLLGVLLAAAGVVALSGLFAVSVQRLILRPLSDLTRVARSIAERADYSVRAVKFGEDEIGVLSDAFNRMLEEVARRQGEAAEALRIREDFLAVASHELKTPLTPLKIHLQRLRRAVATGAFMRAPPERLANDLDSCVRQTSRLEKLVGNLLDLSRLNRGFELEREETDFAGIVRDVVGRFEHEFARTGSRLRLTAPEPVSGAWDPLRLDQVVTNLVTNALKFGEGRPIEVTVTGDETTARLAVVDHGIGIGAEDRERVFGRFERAVPLRHYGGLGLGLYISSQIIRAHRGTIRIESSPGGGATFVVELPRRA